MNNALQPSIFNFVANDALSHAIRTVEIGGAVWFVAKDVFETLSLAWNGARTLSLIPEAWRVVVKLTTTQNNQYGTQDGTPKNVHLINFKAVCKVAFRSNKPEADSFTNWAAEVIEQVLKTGSYALNRIAQTTKTDRIPLKDAVTRLVATTKAMNYSQAYKLIHAAFDVDDIDQIPKEKLHVAVTYVNGLIGEYIPYQKPNMVEVPDGGKLLTRHEVNNLRCAITHMICVGDWWRKHGRIGIAALNKNMAAGIHDHFVSGYTVGSMEGRSLGIDVDYLKSIPWDTDAQGRAEHRMAYRAAH